MMDLQAVYVELHKVLAPFAAMLVTTRDDGQTLYVDTPHLQGGKKPLFFGAVQLKKAYVSFHLMPVYLQPALLDSVSQPLRSRMQGKSCFNFTRVEPELFRELAALTAAGLASYRAQGYAEPATCVPLEINSLHAESGPP